MSDRPGEGGRDGLVGSRVPQRGSRGVGVLPRSLLRCRGGCLVSRVLISGLISTLMLTLTSHRAPPCASPVLGPFTGRSSRLGRTFLVSDPKDSLLSRPVSGSRSPQPRRSPPLSDPSPTGPRHPFSPAPRTLLSTPVTLSPGLGGTRRRTDRGTSVGAGVDRGVGDPGTAGVLRGRFASGVEGTSRSSFRGVWGWGGSNRSSDDSPFPSPRPPRGPLLRPFKVWSAVPSTRVSGVEERTSSVH